jgi:CHAT domain-containing protein
MKKHPILFLAANPGGTTRLALDREAHAIHAELERSSFRDRFQLVTRWAPEPIDLLRDLRKFKPTVVHFSGHGCRMKSTDADSAVRSARDVVDGLGVDGEPRGGLVFQGPFGTLHVVSAAAIAEAFGAVETSVKLVVLSACYTAVQAEALLAHVECVVGTSGSINDDAARSFAIGFYSGLGERESIHAAYMQGAPRLA